MRARILTAILLGALLVAVLLYGPPLAVRALFGVFVVAGAWEWSAFTGARRSTARLGYTLLVAALALAGRYWLGEGSAFRQLMEWAALWWLIQLLWILMAPRRVGPWAAGLAGLAALPPTWIALTHIAEAWPRGTQWVLFVLALGFAADTGAFFAGRAWGHTKLAPLVSPAKTWEGVAGGLLLAAAAALLGSHWFGVPAQRFVPLCLLGAAFSVIGDLAESMFKRASGLKDSGRIFPGHGGVLDRIDSALAATPVMCLGLLLLAVGA